MRFLEKLGLALFSIIVLVISVVLCLIAFGWMESTIFSILIGKVLISQTYTYPKEIEESDDGILLQNEDGKLLITVETLKNMVDGVINEIPNITDSSTGVLITKENDIIISVSIDVTKETVIKDVSSKLQVKIKKAIKDATDLDIKAVNVRVRNAETVSSNSQENVEEKVTEEVIKKEKVVKEAPEPKKVATKTATKATTKSTTNKNSKKSK